MPTISFSAVILFALAVCCAALSSFVLWHEIGEVNRKLGDDEQISYWVMHPAKMARIKSEYVRLYPSGKLDLVRRILQYAMFVFAALLLIPMGFFK